MTAGETVPCGLCGKPTMMTGTKRCDACWELEGRIHRDPALARRILAECDPTLPGGVTKKTLIQALQDSGMVYDAGGGIMKPSVREEMDLTEEIDALYAALSNAAPGAPQQEESSNRVGYVAPKGRYVPPVLFNPYTGEPRDARDIHTDPNGALIVPPGANLVASRAAATAPAGGVTEALGCFQAAIDEGLYTALAETTDERLKDLVERRLMHAIPALTTAARAAEPDMVQQCMAIINAAWAAIPEHLRVDDGTDPTGNPLPTAVRALAARAAEPARLDLSGLQRYRLSKTYHSMNRDPEGPYVQWDAVVALAASPTPPTGAARAAEPEGEIEAYAMRMSWSDQSPDEQAHYLKVAKSAKAIPQGAPDHGR